MRRMLFVALVAATTMAVIAPAAHAASKVKVKIEVVSSHHNQVSGGDALISVTSKTEPLHTLRVQRNGMDVTNAFSEQDGALVGLVDRLRTGKNEITVTRGTSSTVIARQKLTNYPNTGPIFSGPHQEFFVCNTIQAGLGEPLVDNQDGEGFRVQNPDGSTAGWSLDCSANTRVDYLYRTTGGSFRPLPSATAPVRPTWRRPRSATAAPSTTSCAASAARSTASSTRSRCSRRSGTTRAPSIPTPRSGTSALIFTFDGGVQIGHRQGTPGRQRALRQRPQQGLRDHPLLRHAHEHALQPPARRRDGADDEGGVHRALRRAALHGRPWAAPAARSSSTSTGRTTRKLLDAGIPQYSYPDMVTQTIHVGDCELLERYMDSDDGSNPKWQNWDNREWLEGLNAHATLPNPYRGGAPGNSECVKRLARAHAAGAEPALVPELRRARPHGSGRDGEGALDPRGGREERLRRRPRRLRAQHVRQRRRPVRAEGAEGRQHHAGGVPERERPGRRAGRRRRTWSRRPSRSRRHHRRCRRQRPGFDPWSAGNMRLSPDGGVTPAAAARG